MRLTRLICLASALLCLPMCAAPAVAQLGQYQAVPRTLQNGERSDVLLDVNGAQIVSSGAVNGSPPTGGATVVAGSDGTVVRTMRTDNLGNVATVVTGASFLSAGSADSGNSLKIGARVAASKTGLTGNTRTDILSDVFGNVFVRPVTGILSGLNGLGPAWASYGANDNPNYAGAPVGALGFMYNGTTLDAVRGDTTGGVYTQERERSQYGFELAGALAAGGTYTGAGRDGGVSPSQWGTFSCFVRSDQASAAGGFGIQGSNDGTNWFVKVLTSVSAGTSVRVTDRNDTRYSRCVLTNGATANTLAPNINYSFGS